LSTIAFGFVSRIASDIAWKSATQFSIGPG